MSLPLKAIDRLFERLILTYGKSFMARWDGLGDGQIAAVKTLWASDLGVYAQNLGAIAWALENLPERAPNVIEFKNLCRSAPRRPDVMAIETAADPKKISEELVKLVELKAKAIPRVYDGKQWARNIIARHDKGEKVKPINLRFAREALKSSLDMA